MTGLDRAIVVRRGLLSYAFGTVILAPTCRRHRDRLSEPTATRPMGTS
ncbi:hypothetical protein [Nocardia sp. MW-W600-9]